MRTLIAVCDDVADVRVALPDVDVVVVPELCTHPGSLTSVADGATSLVVGLCARGGTRREIQSVARRVGVDALAVQFLDVAAADGDPVRLRALATAAAERAVRFAGSRPEHAKPTFPASLGRRSLLRMPLPEYVAVPAVEQELCAASEGCTACVEVCPNDAYRWAGGRVEVDPARCEPCGRCLTACPTGAASNPAWTPAQLRAEVRGLLEDSGEPRGVVFTCSRADAAETEPGWLPVVLPCTGMVTAGWVLAPLVLGAHGVVVRRCGDVGCPLGNDGRTDGAVDLARRVLAAVGVDEDRVATRTVPLAAAPLAARDDLDLFSALGELQAVTALADAVGVSPVPRLPHPAAAAGQVHVGDACTLCGACATGCPTDALTFAQDGQGATLSFDAARCTACEQCVQRCPERAAGAIDVEHVLDVAAATAGSVVLLRDDLATCVSCGRPFSSERLIAHVAGLLGEEHAAMYAQTSRRCLDCRSNRTPVL